MIQSRESIGPATRIAVGRDGMLAYTCGFFDSPDSLDALATEGTPSVLVYSTALDVPATPEILRELIVQAMRKETYFTLALKSHVEARRRDPRISRHCSRLDAASGKIPYPKETPDLDLTFQFAHNPAKDDVLIRDPKSPTFLRTFPMPLGATQGWVMQVINDHVGFAKTHIETALLECVADRYIKTFRRGVRWIQLGEEFFKLDRETLERRMKEICERTNLGGEGWMHLDVLYPDHAKLMAALKTYALKNGFIGRIQAVEDKRRRMLKLLKKNFSESKKSPVQESEDA